MAKGEINLLCSEIDTLLTDICKFLNEEIGNGTISENGRAFANVLIERSKVQLKAISKVTSALEISDPASESYVDMQGPKVVVNTDDCQEVYSDVSFEEGISNFSTLDDASTHYDICPFENLPACDIKDGKSGFLHRKERFLFFDQQRKIFAAIQQSWFLIYINEHALKPSQTFDLAGFNAKSNAASKETKKRDESFSLFSLTDLKTYQFTAQTSKDMLQWVAAINLQCDLIRTKRSLPAVPTTKVTAENTDGFESESSNEYEPLTEYQLRNKQATHNQQNSSQSTPVKKPLPLPPRNTPTKPNIIERVPSEESMGDYDCVGPEPQDSFSEDNEDDAFYDNPTELKQRSNFVNSVPLLESNAINDEDEIYDYLQDPNQALGNSHLINNFSTASKSDKVQGSEAEPKQRPNFANNVTLLETNAINNDDDDEIYDCLQDSNQSLNSPQLITNFSKTSKNVKSEKFLENHNKEKAVKEKSKPTLKPKILSFSNKRKNH